LWTPNAQQPTKRKNTNTSPPNGSTQESNTMKPARTKSGAHLAKVLDILDGLAEQFGESQINYSAPDMQGATCAGIITQHAQSLQDAAMRHNIAELSDMKTESTGHSTVVYWPQVKWPTEPAHARKARKHLYWHLQGYGRGNVARLRSLAAIEKWDENARRVLQARAYRMLEGLDDHILRAIAEGTLNVHEQVGLVADELDAQKNGGAHD
jgi:hypothetical protein